MKDAENLYLRELILKSRTGDDDAFSELVGLYSPMLRNVALKLSLDAEESFSEACMGLYKAMSTFDLEQQSVTFGLYARICVSRRLLDIVRRERADSEVMQSDVDVEKIPVDGNILSRLVSREENEELRKWVRGLLSDYEYRVFRMWAVGSSAADISRELSTDVKSVENAKGRIIKKFRGSKGRR